MVFFQGVALGTMLQWMAPHPEVYGQHRLESMGYKAGELGGGGRERVGLE